MHASDVVRGMVFLREAEGDIHKVENAKIAMFSCALDSETTETKVRSEIFIVNITVFILETFLLNSSVLWCYCKLYSL